MSSDDDDDFVSYGNPLDPIDEGNTKFDLEFAFHIKIFHN